MNLKDRIKQYRKTAGLTLEAVANKIGDSKQTVQKYENGIISNIPSDRIEAMAKAFGCTPADLMGWNSGSKANEIPAGFEPLPKMVKIPLIGEIACGTPILAEQNIEDYVDCPALCKATFALRCHGDSMINAEIHDGDIVFIRKQETVENGQIAAVQIDDGNCYDATLKRFYRSDNTVMLMAENPKFPPLSFHNEEINKIHIAGRAVYCLSKIK